MAKTKKDVAELKWQCPVCEDIRYSKEYIPVPGIDQDDKPTIYQAGHHYECKGCSVKFGNPRLFNKLKVS